MREGVRLIERIGAGGMGAVWLARHEGLDNEVAIKFVHSDALSRERTLRRFKREASLAAKIRNPHVVEIFDYGVTADDTPYIIMERLHGMSLRGRVERSTLNVRKTALLVRQVAEALTAAHALGVVHRDLKPDNVFLVDNRYELFVKLLDFGIAKPPAGFELERITKTGSIVGTPYYMSPEQFQDPKGVDHRADLWALAIITYFALTGELPFRGRTLPQLTRAVHSGQFTPVTSLLGIECVELDVWFKLALCRAIEGRYPDAATMAKAFREAAGAAVERPSPSARAPENQLFDAAFPPSRRSGANQAASANESAKAPVLVEASAPSPSETADTVISEDSEGSEEAPTSGSDCSDDAVPSGSADTYDGAGVSGSTDVPEGVGVRRDRALIGLALAIAVVVLMLVARHRSGIDGPHAATQPSVMASADAPPAASAPTGTAPTSTAPSRASSTATVTPPLPSLSPSALPKPHPHVSSRAPEVPVVDCSKPYVVDANGDLQAKAECL